MEMKRSFSRKRSRSFAPRAGKRARRFVRRGRLAAPGELKFLDTTVGLTNCAAAGVILSSSLNVVAEGNGESERVGRKITISSLHIKGRWANTENTASNTTDNRVRILVYCDKQTNGAAATVLGVLETANVDSFRNLSDASRFRVLYDKTSLIRNQYVAQTAAGTFTTCIELRSWVLNLKLNLPIEYDSSVTTGAIGSQRTNNIGVLILCDIDAGVPQVGFTARIRYKDM